MSILVHRVRVVVTAAEPVRHHAVHSPAVYALLAAAFGRAGGTPAVLPDGVLLDAPEQCRVSVRPGERYAFGFTLLAPDTPTATDTATQLVRGLRSLGENGGPHRPAWGSNFRVTDTEDLIAGRSWSDGSPLAAIPADRIESEVGRLLGTPDLGIRFDTPFRAERAGKKSRKLHKRRGEYFDRTYFPPAGFLSRLWHRLAGLKAVAGDMPPTDGLGVADNRLVWLEFSYGFAHQRKRLGGAVGDLTLTGVPADWLRPLVLGQYVRVGLNTRFGFGGYRLVALGPDPYPCRRAVRLLDLALTPFTLAQAAEREDLPMGRMLTLAADLRAGSYAPPPPTTFELPRADGPPRSLAIPRKDDRALQRALLSALAAGLDPLFEDSSLAFRKGLGRHRAAQVVQAAFADGFRWAVRSDVHRFFDSVPHDDLRHRLAAYLNDGAVTDRVMAWVTAHAPTPGVGLPTGSPLSPLLANLFLDAFDEAVAADGGRLVRYADDFLILTRTREQAERLFAVAESAAGDLLLQLNADKTNLLDLHAPFDFLGFRFERTDSWQSRGSGVRSVAELGWTESSAGASTSPAGPRFRPAGEVDAPADGGETIVAGPGEYDVRLVGDRLACGDGPPRRLDELDAVILLGSPTLAAEALRGLADVGVPVVVADDRLRTAVFLVGDTVADDPDAIRAQLALSDPERLILARPLVAAKLRNYAVLADGTARKPDGLGDALRALADRAVNAASFDELLGLEGAGGRRWYEALSRRLPAGWHFPGRIAPDADDPVNVLLNIGQTYLYRWATLACRFAGLLPAVGVLHRCRSGHAALASDLQEPFRFLVDRAVLELLERLKPSDFRKTPARTFRLSILPHASQLATAAFTQTLTLGIPAGENAEPKSYRRHLMALARGLRRRLVAPTHPWTPLVVPS